MNNIDKERYYKSLKEELIKERQRLAKLFIPKVLSLTVLFSAYGIADFYKDNNLKYNTNIELYDEFDGTYYINKYTRGYDEGETYIREYTPVDENGYRYLTSYRVSDKYPELTDYIDMPVTENQVSFRNQLLNQILGAKSDEAYRTIVRYKDIDYNDTQNPENLNKVRATLLGIWALLDMFITLINRKNEFGNGIIIDVVFIKSLLKEINETLNDISYIKNKLNDPEIDSLLNSVINKYDEVNNNIEQSEYVKNLK